MKRFVLNLVLAVVVGLLAWASFSPTRVITMAVPGAGLCEKMMAMSTINLHDPVSGDYIFAYVSDAQGSIFYLETDAQGRPVVGWPVSNSADFMGRLAADGWLLSCSAKEIKAAVRCEASTVWALAGAVDADNTQDLWFRSQNMARDVCEIR